MALCSNRGENCAGGVATLAEIHSGGCLAGTAEGVLHERWGGHFGSIGRSQQTTFWSQTGRRDSAQAAVASGVESAGAPVSREISGPQSVARSMGPESGLLERSDLAPVVGSSRAGDPFIESCVAISHDATHAPRRSASLRGQSGAEAI